LTLKITGHFLYQHLIGGGVGGRGRGIVGIMGQLSPGSAMSRVRFNILDLVNKNLFKYFPKPKVNRGIF
jgi:hypothetical protein